MRQSGAMFKPMKVGHFSPRENKELYICTYYYNYSFIKI